MLKRPNLTLTLCILAAMQIGLAACKSIQTSSASNDQTVAPTTADEDEADRMSTLLRAYAAAATNDDRQRLREAGWRTLARLDQEGRLDDVILVLLRRAPQTRDLPETKQRESAEMIATFAGIEIANRPDFSGANSWASLTQHLGDRLGQTTGMPLKTALSSLGATRFLAYDDARLLVDGPASWAERERLIAGAQRSIWVASWAFYDDLTGNDFGADLLIAAKARGVDVRVMVDGPVSMRPVHDPVTRKMAEAGIEVMRWSLPGRKGFGMHRKLIVVDHADDGAAVIFGGMNFGDEYSHKKADVERVHKWRDTDILVTGAAVASQGAAAFAREWNDSVERSGAPGLTRVQPVADDAVGPDALEGLAFVDHSPSRSAHDARYLDPILLTTLRMIESARETIEISNAYYVLFEPMERALNDAARRGVHIRIHTNSKDSMAAEDQPMLGPIYKSLARTLTPPANRPPTYRTPVVYLQRERTVHSKYIVVDGVTGWLGSYNVHPRSSRYEGELVGMFHGPRLGGALQRQFAKDAEASTEVTTPEAVTLPASTLADLLETFFFDQI